MQPFIALIDFRWFDLLSGKGAGGVVDEVNICQRKALRPLRKMTRGEPVFLRLKSPHFAVVGYGFFAHFEALRVEEAWSIFGWRNGATTAGRFVRRAARVRGKGAYDSKHRQKKVGCTILRAARLWPESQWLPWGDDQGWLPSTVGKTEHDPARAAQLLACIERDRAEVPRDLRPNFALVDIDLREIATRERGDPEGQGTFRLRLLDAYQRCAITGEPARPVLDAVHIQPYLGPGSNQIQNGLILTQELRTLFDAGYLTITDEYTVRISDALGADYPDSRRYYAYDTQRVRVPQDLLYRPSRAALRWHREQVFRG